MIVLQLTTEQKDQLVGQVCYGETLFYPVQDGAGEWIISVEERDNCANSSLISMVNSLPEITFTPVPESIVITSENITNQSIGAIKASYIEKELDGKAYYDFKRAELVIDYQLGNKTEADLYEIEDAYEIVFKKLRRGDWMSAANKLGVVTIGGAVTQAYHDDVTDYINNYIATNY